MPANLPGLDIDTALRNVGGNRSLLRKLLADLVEDHAQDVQVLEAALAAGDTVQAQRMAHTLKGVAGTLGATALQQTSAHLERALRQGQTDLIQDLMEPLRGALTPLMASLREWVQAEGLLPATSRGPVDLPVGTKVGLLAQAASNFGEIEAAMRELQTLLDEFNPEAAEQAEALSKLLGPEMQQVHELIRLTALFDFEAASAVLQDLRTQLQATSASADPTH